MPFKVRCWRPLPAALAVVTTLLTACARVSSEGPHSACPPVVEDSRAEQVRVAAELAALPDGAVIADSLADYAALRDQARACAKR